ncbi:PepSY domain-containing protein [Piscinibacter sakaiensis]|uniref:Putative lipoprotein n=1 Tax=Piscinibacter sakaiensis TaxID=1547922 RepID=A0A0K8P8E1_PISS1|nr:PepSY domain-containing protein [Piscinibacter sakaiensis]GAP38774.1 putative lipoprotein [Piscinibacter sakaiensis]
MSPRCRRPPGPSVLAGLALLAGLAAVASLPARADSEQDRARAAVQAGAVLPLRTVLERLEREHPGQVLEVELEREDGRWVYEIKLLQAGGRLVKLELDAATGELLRRRERTRPGAPAGATAADRPTAGAAP